jgi:hypothetical protein
MAFSFGAILFLPSLRRGRLPAINLSEIRPSNQEAANFICVWYSPPFGDGSAKVAPEKMLDEFATSSSRHPIPCE